MKVWSLLTWGDGDSLVTLHPTESACYERLRKDFEGFGIDNSITDYDLIIHLDEEHGVEVEITSHEVEPDLSETPPTDEELAEVQRSIRGESNPEVRQDPEFLDFEERVVMDVMPKLEDSAMTISLVPKGPTDVKFAVELGLSIMLNKPIIAVAVDGAEIPPKLEQFADYVVRGDLDSEETKAALHEAITKTMGML